jgi:hypothetical protein
MPCSLVTGQCRFRNISWMGSSETLYHFNQTRYHNNPYDRNIEMCFFSDCDIDMSVNESVNIIQGNSYVPVGCTTSATASGMVTPKGSMSTEGETLQVSVLPYRYSICPFCCVCLGCCSAEFGSSGGTFEYSC